MTNPPPPLDRLIRRLTLTISAATETLEGDPQRAPAWRNEVARQLRRYHQAAYLLGAGVKTIDEAAWRFIRDDLAVQLKFLGQFAVEIAAAGVWEKGWNARAAMYARSIQVPFNRGVTRLLPLPAMPGDGSSACLVNCKCFWRVDWIDEANGDADAYWMMGGTEHHCQTCPQRAAEWAPLQVRNGVLL